MAIGLVIGGGLALGAVIERYGITMLSPNLIKGATIPKDLQIEIEAANLIRAKLVASEGNKTTVYRDSLGIPTVGIGHKVLPSDKLKVGDTISAARVEEFYKKDAGAAFKAAVSQARELNKYNVDMIVALTEVNFQLGTYWRVKFPNTWSLLKSGYKDKAIAALLKSKWNAQTPNRVAAFVSAINRNYA